MGRLFAPFHPPRLRLGGNAPKNMASGSLANAFFKVLAPFLGGHAPKKHWFFGRGTGWSCSELSRLAYELDGTGFHPAFVFEEGNTPNSGDAKQNLYMEICDNDEMTNALSNDGLSSLFYFDGKETAVYVRVLKEKEPDADGCTSKMTKRYRKYVWDGGRFVQRR